MSADDTNSEGLEAEASAAAMRVTQQVLSDLRTAVWDGTGYTLEELPEDWLETVVWRDVGMTAAELMAFMGED